MPKWGRQSRTFTDNAVFVPGYVVDQMMNWLANIEFADGSGAVDYWPGGINLSIDARAVTASLFESSSTPYKVKCSVADTTPEYLHAKVKDQAVFSSGSDMVVAGDLVDDGAVENVKFFVDVSAISGWSGAAAYQFLVNQQGTVAWVTASVC